MDPRQTSQSAAPGFNNFCEALSELSPEQLIQIIDSIPHFVWISRPDGFISHVNSFGIEYLGTPAQSLMGWEWIKMVHPADRDRVILTWIEATSKGEPCNVRYRFLTPRGELRWNAVRARPVRDSAGKVICHIGTCTDVEEAERSREYLSSANEEIDRTLAILNLFERKAPVGFAVLDRDFRFIRINAALAEVSGHSIIEVLGKPMSEIVPGLWPYLRPVLEKVLSTGVSAENVRVSGEVFAAPHKRRVWQSSYHPVQYAGETIGVAAIVMELPECDDLGKMTWSATIPPSPAAPER